MNLSTLLSASLLLSAFAAGCAVESNTAPVADETQTDEASDALARAAVKGIYVRKDHAPLCGAASTLELRANGTFTATLDYYGPTVFCAEVLAAPLNGTYTLNRRSNVVTFRVARSRATFTLSFARNELSRITGSAANRAAFQGSFRKLSADECVNDAGCDSNEICSPVAYILPAVAPVDPSGAVGPEVVDPGFSFPAVAVGECTPRNPPPLDIICGGIAGLVCPEGLTCVSPATHPDATGVCVDLSGGEPVCTLEYAPVCGVNGITYSNRCFAAGAGVAVAVEGECGPIDGGGVCATIYAPVCGSNGVTYSNACEAGNVRGVTIAHNGKCLAAPVSP